MAKSPSTERFIAYQKERAAIQIINRKARQKERKQSKQKKALSKIQKTTAETGAFVEHGRGRRNKHWGKTEKLNWRTT